MDMPRNEFKARLADPGTRLGLWVASADPTVTEVCAGAGFDWLLLDAEHGPNDVRSLLAQLRAVHGHGPHPIVRPPSQDPNLVKQLLDIGVQTLLVPMVESADQARMMVRAMRYPPVGIRGVGSALARASRYNRVPGYLGKADAQMCLLVQVESAQAMERIDEIAAVDGVDGVFIGPSDLAASMGRLGDAAHPQVRAEVERGIARIAAAGKAPGILAMDEAFARRSIELGCRFVAVGTDITILARGTQALVAAFRSAPT